METFQLIEVIKANNVASVRELVKSGVDINQSDEHGWTALSWAAGKGNLEAVTLLVNLGADIFKVGRDQRTPYMIALAAGHTEVVKFLRQAEKSTGREKSRTERKYCKAYYIKDLRPYSDWKEGEINWKDNNSNGASNDVGKNTQTFHEDDLVFLHQDYSVTRSMWYNENVIFNQVTPEWKEFCANVLEFKAPDDLDLITPAESRL
jgi:ankyrin repeat protein